MRERAKNLARSYFVVLLGIVLYVVLDIIVQSLPPHYSPISQAESDLAVGRFGVIMAVNFVNRALFSLLFIFTFLKTLDIAGVRRKTVRGGFSLLGVWAAGSIILAAFPTDVPPTPMSGHGAVHLIVAIVSFVCGAFGTLLISRNLGKSEQFQNLAKKVAFPLSAIVLLTWLIEFLLPFVAPHLNSEVGGLTERLFLGAMLLWFGIVSVCLIRHVSNLKANIAADSSAS